MTFALLVWLVVALSCLGIYWFGVHRPARSASGRSEPVDRSAAFAAAGSASASAQPGRPQRQAGGLRQRLRPWMWAALALLTLPPLLVVLSGWRLRLSLPEQTPGTQDERLAALLAGEQLVPPPPLPPEVFARAQAEGLAVEIVSADRRWELLDAGFRQRLLAVYKAMREQGYEMVLLEGYRSPERQAMLQRQGPQVTQAGPMQSYHQHGLAADSAFLREGRLVISEADPWASQGYELFGQESERYGLRWGGRWRMRDYGHVELAVPEKKSTAPTAG
ncbi:M15 family metallopeptidase [Mitsuaria sp. WAJ17]|uniref:M15 family metallopeptidase n=1 Tax=Mitsuaria sp. WAJ17 TaxID=2761452 RepID=UPI0028739656|nr:M15 family metallopeptidase [Mitsuaria sp. WAJ17]